MLNNAAYFFISFFFLILFFVVLNIIILFLIRKNVRWTMIVSAGIVYCIFALFAVLVVSNKGAEINLPALMKAEAQRSMDMVMEITEKRGLSPVEIEEVKKMAKFFIVDLYPAWTALQILFIVFLNYFVVRLFALKQYKKTGYFPVFHLWFLDEKVMWIFILSLAGVALGWKTPELRGIAMNIGFVLGVVYGVCGFSVAGFYMKKFKAGVFMQGIIYIIMAFWLLPIMVLTGALDTWFNFRRIEKGGAVWR